MLSHMDSIWNNRRPYRQTYTDKARSKGGDDINQQPGGGPGSEVDGQMRDERCGTRNEGQKDGKGCSVMVQQNPGHGHGVGRKQKGQNQDDAKDG